MVKFIANLKTFSSIILQVVKLLAKDLFIDVIDELVLDISRAVLQAAYDLHSAAQVTVDELIETTTTTLVRYTSLVHILLINET